MIIPQGVVDEIAVGRASGVKLPDPFSLDWVTVRRPSGEIALPLVTDLGVGEAQVLMLALELRDVVTILDDELARRVAENLGLPLTGTLGLLLDAKRAGLIHSVAPILDSLLDLRFRLARHTHKAILKMAGE